MPAPVASMAPRPKSLVLVAEDVRLEVLAKARAVVVVVDGDDAYGVIDRFYEIDPLLESWCDALDAIDAANG